MKIYYLMGVVFLITISFILGRNEFGSPDQTIEIFCQAMSERDYETMKRYLVNEPNYVRQKRFDWLKEVYTPSLVSSKESTETDQNRLERIYPNLSEDELIKKVIPEIFFSQNRFLGKLGQERKTDTEAVVRVKMSSKNLADLEFDFYLFKENGEWKIFTIEYPQTASQYNFYANQTKN